MTLYRGPGGTGSATSDADTTLYQDFLNQTIAARDAALAAETAAELAETNAETAETNAETAEANAETAATNAASSASAAATSASNASSSASSAATSASAASTSATAAASSASSASSSASAASTSATNASTSATNAATSETNAANSATSASNSASTATTQASNAASSASAAATSASSAATSATNASNSASSAATSATNAASSATAAAASATAAAASAASIDPDTLVKLTGDQTIGGTKTFTSTISGSITGNAGTVTNGVYTTGDQTIAGTKTFSNNPVLSAGTVNGLAFLNASKVLTTGSALTFDGSRLGINIASPTLSLEIGGSNATGYIHSGVGVLSIGSKNNYPVTFDVNNAEQMRLTSTGLGIGTSSPTEKLTVAGAISTRGGNSVLFYRGDNTRFGSIYCDNDGLNIRQPLNDYIIFEKNDGTNLATLDPSGNLGLGVTPSAWGGGNRGVIDLGTQGAVMASTSVGVATSYNSYFDGTNWVYKASGSGATRYTGTSTIHAWYTAPSGTAGNAISFTQAMTLDASGRLLVGYTSSQDGSALQINANSVGATVYTAAFNNSSTSTSVYNAVRWQQGASGSAVGYVGTGGSAVGNASFQNNFVIGTQTNSPLVFNTGDSERARITSGGDLLVGTTSAPAAGRMRVAAPSSSALIQLERTTTSAGSGFIGANVDNALHVFNGSISTAFYVTQNGSCFNGTGTYGSFSDVKVKENIVDATPKLEDLMQVRVVNYNRIGQSNKEIGVIAQELEQIFPGLVEESKDFDKAGSELGTTTKSVKYSVFVPMLIKAIQEQQAIIEQLKADVAALKGNP